MMDFVVPSLSLTLFLNEVPFDNRRLRIFLIDVESSLMFKFCALLRWMPFFSPSIIKMPRFFIVAMKKKI